MKEALLVMVHGSPRPASNRDMYEVVEALRQRNLYFFVAVGFLECNAPTISEAIQQCIEQGVERVIAVPYFLHSGNHVADDLPTLLEAAQAQYPTIEFLMGDYLGRDPHIADVIMARVAEAQPLAAQ